MTDPDSEFVRVATAHLSALFGRAIERRGYSAGVLAQTCGGVESGWRNKLSGRRQFRLQDVLSLAATYDLQLLNLLFPSSDGVDASIKTVHDLVPADHAGLIELERGQLPVLRTPMHRWTTLRQKLEAWVLEEIAAGRGAQLSEDVVIHQVLKELDNLGLHSNTASVARTTGAVRVTWSQSSSVADIYFEGGRERTERLAVPPARAASAASSQSAGDAYASMSWMAGSHDTEPQMRSFEAQSVD